MMVGILQELAELKDEREESREKACKNQLFVLFIDGLLLLIYNF
jgi:hypothetical protein